MKRPEPAPAMLLAARFPPQPARVSLLPAAVALLSTATALLSAMIALPAAAVALLATSVLLPAVPVASAQSLPRPLARAARTAEVNLAETSIVVLPVEGKGARLSFNARRAMNPASTMKLVTTAAALHLLGPAHTWRTEALIDGLLVDGVLQGDLILKGAGDPKLTLEEFWMLLRTLRQRGVRHIQGNLVIDRTLFAPMPGHPGDFDGDGLRPYNALPDAMLVNFNAIRLDFVPRPDTHGVDVLMSPSLSPIRIENLLRLADGECLEWPQDPTPTGDSAVLRFEGLFPAACGETTRNYSPLGAPRYVDALFRALWQEIGGSLSGQVVEGHTPTSARAFAAQDSEPLAEVIRDINKFSNNVMARQLFLSLAAVEGTPPLAAEQATKAVQNWLRNASMEFPELIIENGSGLSRHERISAGNLARLLRRMARSPFAPEYMASLPLSALDGTMRKRLNEGPVAGRAHIKTGYLDGVRASAGYVLDRNDRLLVVVCLVNGGSASASQPFHDALIEWAYNPRAGSSGSVDRGEITKKRCCDRSYTTGRSSRP